LFAALGVTCAACGVKPLRPNKQNGHIPCASAKIIAPKFGAEEGLLVMDGYIIERLPMPETEGELFKLLREYSDQNYWIAELC
jgi:hypothetical protein